MATWIIVVDDDTANLTMAGHVLSRNNMRVTALRSGKALLDYIGKNSSPDLILLDIKMPEMDGFETLDRLRGLERSLGRDETPVIFLTADESADTETKGLKAGVSDYIKKPFEPEVLLRSIGNIMSKQEKLPSLKAEAAADELTGSLNRSSGGKLFPDGVPADDMDIQAVSAMLGERSIPNVALQLDKEAFAYVYRYVMRYIVRNQLSACKVMFTLSAGVGSDEESCRKLCDDFGTHIRDFLRKSDIFMRSREDKYFVFLTDIRGGSADKVIGNMLHSWREKHGDNILITYETEFVGSADRRAVSSDKVRVAVVDDDIANLQMAGHILSKAGYYVAALKSGQALLDYVEKNIPDLILLDINMPVTDGFETMKKLKDMEREIADIPVIFLTADESAESESMGLSLGAMDFIKKPFVPEVLLLRVRHSIELITLQRSLSSEVEKKSRENRELFLHVVQSLAEAIDAKDTYTNGHSGRVAEYSKEIAKRAGYTVQQQNDIYMMGLLHDVGKIGIPDAVINKPARLTDEEFEIIKNHPVMGARILKNIREMPKLATGARWHHERYAGGGYPDGLSGEDIPEEARIIAVADAYDAMTSRRSYRDVMSQEHVRGEIEKGRGTQFDPRFADIMLAMIDEDTEYNMREK